MSSNTAMPPDLEVVAPDQGKSKGILYVVGIGPGFHSVSLSWTASVSPNIAGYNVYRSEQDGVAGTRVNAELLRTPAFRDTSTIAGRRYSYSVTAVDRAGNESPASDAVSAGIPAESQPQP